MKKSILSLFAIAALALASCSSEDIKGPNGGENAEGEPIGYMGFTISTDASRALDDEGNYIPEDGDFADGDEYFNSGETWEYAMAPHNRAHLAIFFYGTEDGDGTYYGSSYLSSFDNEDNGHGATHNPSQYAESERYYTYITRWRNADQRLTPNRVLVILNENPTVLEELRNELEASGGMISTIYDKINSQKGLFKHGDITYFTMSNSVFVQDGKVVTATEIPAGAICATPEEALNRRVTVYVERVLAKHTLTFGDKALSLTNNTFLEVSADNAQAGKAYVVESYTGEGTNEDLDYPETTETTWSAYVSFWNMNALEQTSFVYKHIGESLTSAIEPFADYNNAALHRSYWALSPNYNEAFNAKYGTKSWFFPTQYRSNDLEAYPYDETKGWNVFEGAMGRTNYGFDDETDKAQYTNHFISFEQIYDEGYGEYPHRYTFENTKDDAPAFYGYAPYRYNTHVLIAAQLVFDNEKTAAKLGEQNLLNVSDKWYAYNYYWKNLDDYIRFSYRKLSANLADGLEHDFEGTTYRTVDDWTLYTAANNGAGIAVKDAATYFTTEEAYNTHGDGKRTIRLKDGYTLYVKTQTYDEETGETTYAFVELTKKALTNFVYELTEAVRHYNQGRMYYAVPIQHKLGKTSGEVVEINKYAGYTDPAVPTDPSKVAEKYKLGQFGVVRNHWYKLNVKLQGSIKAPGIPVDDPEQPIIPDPEDEYSIALEIVVLPWHVIDMGDVNL